MQNTSAAVMQQRKEPADSLDFFPTPPWSTRALCNFLEGEVGCLDRQHCWEPACGEGHMAKPLGEYFESVYASDVHPYGFGEVRDFLWPGDEPAFDWIVTNPPFRLAQQFAKMAVDRARRGAALLVRSAFLEGVERHRGLFQPLPPTFILQFTERVPMVKGRYDPKASTATSYCWLVWDRRSPKTSFPRFGWLAPCRKKLEREVDWRGAAE